ncbi:helix-turn-helix domain-containing protein [Paenibacillus amylolyticus]|nr:helix-turn-helix domain-containing protein [Paenibacillus amylolyticus]
MTPLEYLMRYRLLKAKEMLIENNATTAHEIAKAVGFNSASYFGSVFKKYEGISPIELRKQYLD